MRLCQTPLLLKNEESIDNKSIKGANTSELLWNPSEGGWHPSEGGVNFQLVNGIPQRESGIPQKEVNCIYV